VPVLVIDHHLVLDKASGSQVFRSMSNIFMVDLHTQSYRSLAMFQLRIEDLLELSRDMHRLRV